MTIINIIIQLIINITADHSLYRILNNDFFSGLGSLTTISIMSLLACYYFLLFLNYLITGSYFLGFLSISNFYTIYYTTIFFSSFSFSIYYSSSDILSYTLYALLSSFKLKSFYYKRQSIRSPTCVNVFFGFNSGCYFQNSLNIFSTNYEWVLFESSSPYVDLKDF